MATDPDRFQEYRNPNGSEKDKEDKDSTEAGSAPPKSPSTLCVDFEKLIGNGFDASDILIKVEVGEHSKPFFVHRNVLCSSSNFLKSKVKPEWLNEKHPTVDLTDHAAPVFNVYVNWLYGGCIPAIAVGPSGLKEPMNDEEWLVLAKAYVLGEGLLDDQFKNAIFERLLVKLKGPSGDTVWYVAGTVVQIIYEGTPEGCRAQKMLIELFLDHVTHKSLMENKPSLPHQFLLDLLAEFVVRRKAASTQTFSMRNTEEVDDDWPFVKTRKKLRRVE